MIKFARVISTILNPFFTFAAVPFILVLKVTGNVAGAAKWTAFTVLFIGAVGYFVYDRVKKGTFSDLDVSKREQRKTLFIFLSFVVLIYLLSVLLFHGPPVIFFAILGTFIGLVMISLINTRIKASGHMAVLTIVIVSLCIFYGGYWLISLLLLPTLAWSRITLKRHTPPETLAGFSLGVILVVLMYTLAKVYFAGHV